ncbi:Trm112 family protein [Gordonia sp. PKS22-38]|uniref:Trm112 family protein n=1 Tax=Gordonia prachuapensis TaxID=3115651 RepID=A0ABU7N0D1_9ACTN|nr:Trm112 family protein [Gordonia sp. PKS22-38]
MATRAESIDPITRERLVCPQDRGPLVDAGDELYNPRLRVAYRIDADGIPVMLADEARTVDEAEHARLTSSAPDIGDGDVQR